MRVYQFRHVGLPKDSDYSRIMPPVKLPLNDVIKTPAR